MAILKEIVDLKENTVQILKENPYVSNIKYFPRDTVLFTYNNEYLFCHNPNLEHKALEAADDYKTLMIKLHKDGETGLSIKEIRQQSGDLYRSYSFNVGSHNYGWEVYFYEYINKRFYFAGVDCFDAKTSDYCETWLYIEKKDCDELLKNLINEWLDWCKTDNDLIKISEPVITEVSDGFYNVGFNYEAKNLDFMAAYVMTLGNGFPRTAKNSINLIAFGGSEEEIREFNNIY